MDPIALFTSTDGRLAPKPFWLAVLALYVAGFASQALLAGPVLARSGVWPFVFVQAGLLWAWLAVHIKRRRDAGGGAGGAIAVAVVYGLGLALLVLLGMLFFDIARPTDNSAAGAWLLFALIMLMFSSDFGTFSLLLISLLLLSLLPLFLPLLFSIVTGLRASAAAPASAASAAPAP